MKAVLTTSENLKFEENKLDPGSLFAAFKFKGIKQTMCVHLEGEKRIVYNPNHLFNFLPNRCAFDTDKGALEFIKKYGRNLNP